MNTPGDVPAVDHEQVAQLIREPLIDGRSDRQQRLQSVSDSKRRPEGARK